MHLVCIGASAGGLQPIIEILASIQHKDINATFVVVQHLARDKKSLMKEILAQKVVLPVEEITDGAVIQESMIYLSPPGFTINVKEGTFNLQALEIDFPNKAIDHFFESVALHWTEDATGVILSGTGSDGVVGCQALYEQGSSVLVQNPDEAEFSGMPDSVIKSGFYNQVFEVKNFYTILELLIKNPHENYDVTLFNHVKANMPEFTKMAKDDLNLSLESFKLPTICRRIAKDINQEGFNSVEEYLEFLRGAPEKRKVLFDQLMINVTHFFRDPDFFEALKLHLDHLFFNNPKELRFWVCGCSTGEEAYSLAILLNEYMANTKHDQLPASIKIFATDINSHNIDLASNGIYAEGKLQDMPKEYLDKYFEKFDQTHYRVNDLIRGLIIFSVHDVVNSPPFSRMDLVTCRNLLIYLTQSSQSKALANLVFSLNLQGTLCLGPSESLGVLTKYFKSIDRKWRIFTKQQITRLSLNNRIDARHNKRENQPAQQYASGQSLNNGHSISPSVLFDGLILSKYPHSLILDDSYNVLAFYGKGRNLLKNERDGFLTNQFEELLNGNLDIPFMASLIKAKDQETQVILKSALKEVDSHYDLHIEYFYSPTHSAFFILSLSPSNQNLTTKPKRISSVDLSDTNSIIESLRSESLHLKKELREQAEEKEQLNEELQTSNEELIASNEELQSTNEELNSVNEELYTLNNELQAKMDMVTTSHTDLNNLIETTNVGVIFLGPNLAVRKTTRNIDNVFYIRESDVGRNIFELDFGGYLERVKDKLLASQDFHESFEILTKDNLYYKLDIKPYRDGHGTSRGYVVTLTNVDEAKRNEVFLEDTQADARIGSWMLDLKTGKTKWSREVYNIYEIPLGTPTNLAQGKASYPKEEQEKLERFIKGAASGISFAETFRFVSSSNNQKYVRVTGKPVYSHDDEVTGLRGSIQDVTDFQLKQASTQEALAASKTAVFDWSPITDKMIVDGNWNTIFDVSPQPPEKNNEIWLESIHPEDREEFSKATDYALKSLENFDLSYRIVTAKGEVKHVQVRFKIIRDETNEPVRVFGTVSDVSRLKSTETELKEQYKLLAQTTRMAQLGEISAGIGHEINNPLAIALGNHRLIERIAKPETNFSGKDGELLTKALKDQKESLNRIKNLVKSLKNFAHTKGHENQIFDISEALKDTSELFKVLFSQRDIYLNLEVQTGLTTKGNKERFNQVITNLVSNAIDALSSVTSQKVITITAGSHRDNKAIKVSFKDNGPGVPPEVQDKIFNQFFTTKEVGHGTGIGLALCRSIIQQMQGELTLYQEKHKGAEFIIELPLIDPLSFESNRGFKLGDVEKSHLESLKGAVIDDEEAYLSLFCNELSELGPKIQRFTSPLSFLEEINEDNNFDFVITDVNMGEMTGFELLEKLSYEDAFSKNQLFAVSGGMPNFLERKIKKFAAEIFYKPVEMSQVAECLLRVPLKAEIKNLKPEKVKEDLLSFFEYVGPKLSISTTLVEMTPEGHRPTIYVNRAFMEETGYSKEETLKKNLKFLQNKKTQSDAIDFMRKCFLEKETCVVDLLNETKEGTEFTNRLVLVPIEIGSTLFYLGLQSNISAYLLNDGAVLHKNMRSIVHLPLSKTIHELVSLFYQDRLKGTMLQEMAARVLEEVDKINNYILRL